MSEGKDQTPLETIRKTLEPGIQSGAVKVTPRPDGTADVTFDYQSSTGPVKKTLVATGDNAALLTGLSEEKKKRP